MWTRFRNRMKEPYQVTRGDFSMVQLGFAMVWFTFGMQVLGVHP